MPLDGHAYLSSQGWAGSGSGLREGAISKPVIITQKKTLAGIGKDRDEAFPFWDHLYAAAAKTIKLKIVDWDEEDSANIEQPAPMTIARTRTGILSNRRPVECTPTTSGTTTPDAGSSDSIGPKWSLLTLARREAAKKGLYSMFFRGPLLGPDQDDVVAVNEKETVHNIQSATAATVVSPEKNKKKREKKREAKDDQDRPKKLKRRKIQFDEDEDTRSAKAKSSRHDDDTVTSAPRKKKRITEENMERNARKEARTKVKLSRLKEYGDGDDNQIASSKPIKGTENSDDRPISQDECVLTDDKSRKKSKKKRKHSEEQVDEDRPVKSHKKKKKDQKCV